ncbi:MAG TPA: lactonase family protein, partial [Clostridia bacterium]|nr:lactonase family protein [Clostridia bacterium]
MRSGRIEFATQDNFRFEIAPQGVFSTCMNSSLGFQWIGLVLLGALLPTSRALAEKPTSDRSQRVYIGTYTGAKSKGIYLAHFDSATGKLGRPELAAETKHPTFLALHPNGRFLYAVNETGDFGGKNQGSISAFSIDPSNGSLSLLNQQPSGGSGPCHLTVDKKAKCVLAANYGSGSIAALPLLPDGRLSEPATVIQNRGSSINARRQTGPHAHFIAPDPANRFALACDLGLDKVLVYRLNPTQAGLTACDPPSVSVKPGSGPRQLAFGHRGRFIYLLNELSCDVTVFDYTAHQGVLKEVQTISTLPTDFKDQNTCAEVELHPTGKFLYASNRGHNSIAAYSIDKATGKLNLLEYCSTQGKTPRHFALAPNGRWLLAENQDSDSIVVFAVDPATGRLTPTDQSVSVGSPVCAVFAKEK